MSARSSAVYVWIALCAACTAPVTTETRPRPRDAQPSESITKPSATNAPAAERETSNETKTPVPTLSAPMQANLVPPWKDARETPSNGGAYVVRWRSSPDVIARGATFELDVWVFAASAADVLLTTTSLSVDADMPEHLHGMNRIPRVLKQADGSFHVAGMLFHMSGRWELDFDVRAGAISERAQVRVDVE